MDRAFKKSRSEEADLSQAITSLACTHFGEHSEIEAFIQSTGKWETLAVVYPVGNMDAEDVASFIVRAVKQQ